MGEITKTLGGDRLGAGKKMQTNMHGYGRSNHNLSEGFISSMAPGVLVPFLNKIALNGDTFDIDLQAMVRTLPTVGPLFSSFKLQADIFVTPIRLYNGLMHNNATDLGYNMNNVFLPKITLEHDTNGDLTNPYNFQTSQISKNALMRYLGVSGIGTQRISQNTVVTRKFNATSIINYYDIFKNYYANKQEPNAYVITPNIREVSMQGKVLQAESTGGITQIDNANTKVTISYNVGIPKIIKIVGINLLYGDIDIEGDGVGTTLNKYVNNPIPDNYVIYANYKKISGGGDYEAGELTFMLGSQFDASGDIEIQLQPNDIEQNDLKLQPFELKQIDLMRKYLLYQDEGTEQSINDFVTNYLGETPESVDAMPYGALIAQTETTKTWNKYPMNGLCIKTYQSDIFNAWLNTTTYQALKNKSNISTASGSFSMDALNMAKKIYNLNNRIIASGGTLADWEEAVYGVTAVRRAETPMYMGGMSSEIVFEEVIATADTETETTTTKVGNLAGKGTLQGRKGGKVVIKVTEPSIIMGIVSITPRLCYSQGNDWAVNLDTIDDLHKPELDGIGFQDLMIDQLAWFGTPIVGNDKVDIAVGKIPAWMNYMTSFNKCYGDFLSDDSYNYMVLDRNYEPLITNNQGHYSATIKDITTYIDPMKFNAPFAYQDLMAQNFWVQIYSNITARRIISAKMIPNL